MGGDFSRSENYRSGTSTVDLTPTSPRPGSPTSTSVSSAATLNKWDNLYNMNVTFSNVNQPSTQSAGGNAFQLATGALYAEKDCGRQVWALKEKKKLIWSTIIVVFRRGQLATTVRSAAGDPPGWIWDHRWSTRCLRWDWLLGNNHRKCDSDNPPDVGPRHRRRPAAELHTRCRPGRLQSG